MKSQINMYGTGRPLRWAVTIACQLAFVLFGYDQGVFSGIVGNQHFLDTFGHPSPGMMGIIVSIYNLGCFSGCIVAFLFCEKLGRRKSMWFAMVFVLIGATLQTTAYTVPHMMIARFITGIGTGIETSTVPMYQSELCEADKRGRLVSSEPLFVGVGIVIAYWFDYGMSFKEGGIAWRLPIAFQMVFAVVVVILVFGLPESPRYLYAHGRDSEALQILCDVYGHSADHPMIVKEQTEVLDALRVEKEHGEYKWSQIFKRDEVQTGRRVLLAYGMQFMNQMGGINLVVYYVTEVLEKNVGMTRNMSLIMGGCINIMFVIGSLFPSLLLDRLGRRQPMIWGAFGLAISMMMIAILLSFKDHAEHIARATSAGSVAFFFTYMLIFGGTQNCVPWVYVPEILPLHVRAKGTAIGISSNWLWNFFVVMVTPTLIANLKWRGYLIFMATNFLFMPLVYFAYPETTNMTLEEIDWLFMAPGAVKTSLQVQKYGWGGEDGPPIPAGAHNSTPSTPPGEESKGSTEHVEKV
ncbi:Sugar transporter STL1 [Vanrija pseudolonga]|uniref:Sugar transporter STL1 n=1 Tax=Vanrija pseudolonga TaxID=143232 RepID=A0AAF0YEI6_9TREE|nr:Sugar transporter STL1 [Vanrija pseudolonga]